MASSTKIISLCICAIISSFIIVVEAHKEGNGIIEPFLAAGVLSMLLDKNRELRLARNMHYQQRRPTVQTYEPEVQVVREVQGHVVQEYEEPTTGNGARYETGRYRIEDDTDTEILTEPRYVRTSNRYSKRGQNYKPQTILQTYEPTVQDIQSVGEVEGHLVQDYEEPTRGSSSRYENSKYQYAEEDEDEVYIEPRYVSSTYTGKAQTYEQYQPVVKVYEPANDRNVKIKGHIVQGYQVPTRARKPRYEIVKQPYTSVKPTRVITQPHYVRTSYGRPKYARY